MTLSVNRHLASGRSLVVAVTVLGIVSVSATAASAQTRTSFQQSAPAPVPAADPVGNGIAIGAAVGAGAGLGVVLVAYSTCNEGCEGPSPGPLIATALAIGGGSGALVGWLIDRAKKDRKPAAAGAAPRKVTQPGTRTASRIDIAPVLSRLHKSVRVLVTF